MKLVVFFATLILFLLQGNHALTAMVHHKTNLHAPVRIIENNNCVAAANTRVNYTVIKNARSDSQHDYLFGDDIEDEDENQIGARKFRFAVGCYVVLPRPFVSSNLHNFLKAPRPFPNYLYYKYIMQSVLRL